MKKTIFSIIFLILIFSVFAKDNEIDGVMVEGSTATNDYAEPVSFFKGISLVFTSPAQCDISESIRVDYTEGVRDNGVIVERYGASCSSGEYITLLACDGSSNNPGECQRIFADDYKKENVDDRLDISIACNGNCYDVEWYQGTINNKFVGYDCKSCNDKNCLNPVGEEDQFYCSGSNLLFTCNPNYPSTDHWEPLSVTSCTNCNPNVVSSNVEEVCLPIQSDCTSPNANNGEWVCDDDDLIYKCDNGWKIDGFCGDDPNYMEKCKFDNNVASNRKTLCVIDEVDCRENSQCDDQDGCTIDICSGDGTCDYDIRQCNSGEYCDNGACIEFSECVEDLDCDDNNPNTNDLCVENNCKNKNQTLDNTILITGISIVVVIGSIIFWLLRRKK